VGTARAASTRRPATSSRLIAVANDPRGALFESGGDVSESVSVMGGDQTNGDRAELARLVEASLAITSAPTFPKIAEAASEAIGAIFATRARVVITRGARTLASSPEEPIAGATERITLAPKPNGVGGTFELVPDGLETRDRLTLGHLERVTLSSAERLLLLAEAQESARERQEIVAIVSHDLRTPLQTFAMGLDAIELSVGDPARKKIAPTTARMKRSIGTMTRLLGDLLDVSRIHDARLSVRFEPHPLAPILDELRDLYLPMVEKSGIELTTSVDPDLTMVCDSARVAQALGNLVSNAIRHTERGSVRVVARRVEGGRVRFEVIDTGSGVPADVRARLFDQLYRGESSGRSGGLGLGLYIVKGIVDAHGGTLGVESEVGRGSTFWFELPIERGRPSD
jgi:signal transduction histidine kinase